MESGALVLVLGGHVGVVREEQRDKVQEAVRRREHERGLAGLVQGRKEGEQSLSKASEASFRYRL